MTPSQPPRLLDQLRTALHIRGHSPESVTNHVLWVTRFIRFHGTRHPATLGETEIGTFLSRLVGDGTIPLHVLARAREAVLFLYREVLHRDLGTIPVNWVNPNRPRLLDEIRGVMRVQNKALSTEDSYVGWARRFIQFHRNRHPLEMGAMEVEAFLTHLAVRERVAASTQNQALSAILFMYQQVLGIELPNIQALRAQRPERLPVVLSVESVCAAWNTPLPCGSGGTLVSAERSWAGR